MVYDRIKYVAFSSLTEMFSANKKTCLLSYDKLIKAPYLTSFKPEIAHIMFRARVGVYDIKENFKKKYDGKLSCPFCRQSPEQFEHIFKCNSGILCKKSLKGTTLYEFVTMKDMQKTKEIGKFLVTYQNIGNSFYEEDCTFVICYFTAFQVLFRYFKMFIVIYLVVFKHFITSAPFLVKVCDIVNVLRISNK